MAAYMISLVIQNMCYDKNNANNCGVLGSILVAKGTKYYQKALQVLYQEHDLLDTNTIYNPVIPYNIR